MDVWIPFLAPTARLCVFRSPCTLGDRSWRTAAPLGFHGLDRRKIVSQSSSTGVRLLDDEVFGESLTTQTALYMSTGLKGTIQPKFEFSHFLKKKSVQELSCASKV